MARNPGQLAGVQAGLSELRGRLLFVLFALLVYRIGTHIPIPVSYTHLTLPTKA